MEQQRQASPSSPPPSQLPVLIVGAGVSGLLLAQYLRKQQIPFEIFDRDLDEAGTRGVGWGLTLHWSLSALRSLLPDDLVRRLPEAYVDRAAVEKGATSAFPFYDLSTGELKASTPAAPEVSRIRVSRERFRRLLAIDIDIKWGKAATSFENGDGAATAVGSPSPAATTTVTVHFDDGTSRVGALLVACDGGNSRIRRCLLEQKQEETKLETIRRQSRHQHQQQTAAPQKTPLPLGELDRFLIPVGVMGFKVECTPEQAKPMRDLDPFFLQGADPTSDSFFYFSVLDAPGSPPENGDSYTCQMVVSWPLREGSEPNDSVSTSRLEAAQGRPVYPPSDKGRLDLVRKLAASWAEPFRSFATASAPAGTEVRTLEVYDWPPPRGFRGLDRGEGANHAVLDVADLVKLVISPHIGTARDPPTAATAATSDLRAALDRYEDAVVERARPAVLASRRACLDAHEWRRIVDGRSPLLSKRAPKIDFDESEIL